MQSPWLPGASRPQAGARSPPLLQPLLLRHLEDEAPLAPRAKHLLLAVVGGVRHAERRACGEDARLPRRSGRRAGRRTPRERLTRDLALEVDEAGGLAVEEVEGAFRVQGPYLPETRGGGRVGRAWGDPPAPGPGLTLRRPMVWTHSMVRTSKTSTPYSLYTVTCNGVQPGPDEQSGVSRRRGHPQSGGGSGGWAPTPASPAPPNLPTHQAGTTGHASPSAP